MSSTEQGTAVQTPWPISARRPGAFRRLYAGELRLMLSRRRNQAIWNALAWIILIGLAIPAMWIIMTAFRPEGEVNASPAVFFA